jgi:hypothetical protein
MGIPFIKLSGLAFCNIPDKKILKKYMSNDKAAAVITAARMRDIGFGKWRRFYKFGLPGIPLIIIRKQCDQINSFRVDLFGFIPVLYWRRFMDIPVIA